MNLSKRKTFVLIFLVSFITATVVGFLAGGAAYSFRKNMEGDNLVKVINQELGELLKNKNATSTGHDTKNTATKKPISEGTTTIITQEERIVNTVKKASPSVVSIIITKDLPVLKRNNSDPFQQFFEDSPFGGSFDPFNFESPQYEREGTREQQIGGGTGFVVDSSGLIVTNKHVVSQQGADYTVLTNEGKELEAKVLARHPSRDLAILKVDKKLPALKLGDSDKLKLGQKVVAIGNALGEFRNTVSTGVVSGLKRQITARSSGRTEKLSEVIQTDAAINQGNSGGPLLDIEGKVIGISTAMAQSAENIGFAIPINQLKASINQVQKEGKITIPFLGVRYIILNESLAKTNNISVDYGALIVKGNRPSQVAVVPGSPADKADLSHNDIILKLDGEKITRKNTLAEIITEKEVGEKVEIEYLHQGEKNTTTVTLSEQSS